VAAATLQRSNYRSLRFLISVIFSWRCSASDVSGACVRVSQAPLHSLYFCKISFFSFRFSYYFLAGLAWLTYRQQPSWPPLLVRLVYHAMRQMVGGQPDNCLAQDLIDSTDPGCYCMGVVRN